MATTTTGAPSARVRDQIANLTRVADWIDRCTEAGIEFTADAGGLDTYLFPADAADYLSLTGRLVELVDLSDPDAIKPPGRSGGSWTVGSVGLCRVVVYVRGEVCERVQVGTEVVEVPDPDAPKVRKEQPVYEWRCTSEAVA